MKVWFGLCLYLFCAGVFSQETQYKGHKYSLIQWDKIDPLSWLDLKQWKRELQDRQSNTLWRISKREVNLHEPIGRVLGCSGTCILHRGLGFSEVQFRSHIVEGDELSTKENSYLWVFLYDGTLVRLSAESSISLQEINISDDVIFLHARVNEGNVLWMNRDPSLLPILEGKETDVTFLPLEKWFESRLGVYQEKDSKEDDDLLAFLEAGSESKKMYQRLRKIKEENNLLAKRPSYNFLVMPNGTLTGKNLVAELYALRGSESYAKVRKTWSDEKVYYHYRGYKPQEETPLEANQWYKIGKRGRALEAVDGDQFRWGEFLTSNIPSILLRRETMIKKYSNDLLKTYDKKLLAKDFGYRKWDSLKESTRGVSDLSKRITFLLGYTTKMETSLLTLSEQFRKKHSDLEGLSLKPQEFDDRFFKHALIRYYQYNE